MNHPDIVSSQIYTDPDLLHERYTEMRRNSPITYIEHSTYRPFWALVTHKDISEIAKQNDLFISSPRLTLVPKAVEDYLASTGRGRDGSVRTIIDMDEPDHRNYRNITQSWFLGPGVAKFEARVQSIAKRYVNRMAELGTECDFASDIANWYPLHVIMSILGLPEEDAPFILRSTQAMLAASDPELQQDQSQYGTAEFEKLFEYLGTIVEKRRREPTDDLGSVIANGLVNGQAMGMLETLSYLMLASTAGHETTSSSIGGGLLALIQNPDVEKATRQNPDLWNTGADEVVRWVSPIRHFMRTATRDYAIEDKVIKAGDSVAMFYLSANRDEAVFDKPFEFNPARTPNRHLGFGVGAHFCLGRLLALTEIRTLMRELQSRVSNIQLTGDPKWVQSNFVGALKHLPIQYKMI
ncbi:cytochrome P450 [Polynucleobacter sp. 30F-ANTBAC]|uniref:cytochrome P450 n=1 Tax=Polynucleobacter sp. 30F-ANTBAC TaxID=2689095 RepID=UPI001C0D2798|nr:cytochrome P450 [Polynucleobacter sp. 30F-ANTBAC]MBU3599380.1 cytochrome P450 [Polynucleobacter sp. 30F-ANTBAC]